ncbi:unnamed protein product [Meganyctiphanes norvegica]|uniref:Uncharacterized protein n=1 Tax=Meganyctiphanes norvegica TaxID=48144 RepID=A0AAV2QWU5_MEGNR
MPRPSKRKVNSRLAYKIGAERRRMKIKKEASMDNLLIKEEPVDEEIIFSNRGIEIKKEIESNTESAESNNCHNILQNLIKEEFQVNAKNKGIELKNAQIQMPDVNLMLKQEIGIYEEPIQNNYAEI